MSESEPTHLARYIARCGAASRRDADRLVRKGHVTVNGHVAEHPAQLIHPGTDHVKVDGRRLDPPPPLVYYVLHKPRGVITTRRDPKGRRSVFDILPRLPYRVEAVGRLDIETEGALLLTNDGDLAYALTRPEKRIPRRYHAKVYRRPNPKTLRRIQRGIHLEDGPTQPCRCRLIDRTDKGNTWVEITVTEGRNRLVRRLFERVGHPVSKLRRESFATISIRTMRRGDLRELTPKEVRRLRERAGLDSRRRKGGAKRRRSKKHSPGGRGR